MISPSDGRDNTEDWFFLESTQRKSANNPESQNGQNQTDKNSRSAKNRSKDFIEHELRAMSTLSLYDDSLDKMKTTEADKWVNANDEEKVFSFINHTNDSALLHMWFKCLKPLVQSSNQRWTNKWPLWRTLPWKGTIFVSLLFRVAFGAFGNSKLFSVTQLWPWTACRLTRFFLS